MEPPNKLLPKLYQQDVQAAVYTDRLCHTLLQPHQSYRCQVSSADPPPCPPTAQQSWPCVRVYFVCSDQRQDTAPAKAFCGRNKDFDLDFEKP